MLRLLAGRRSARLLDTGRTVRSERCCGVPKAHSRRIFCTSRPQSQYEHHTYFQHGQQQGYPQTRRSRELIWGIGGVLGGFVAYHLLSSTPNGQPRMQVLATNGDTNTSLRPPLQQVSAGLPGTGSTITVSAENWKYSLREDEDQAQVDPATLVSRLDLALMEERLDRLGEVTMKDAKLRESEETTNSLNEAQLKLHKVLFDILATSDTQRVVLDDALIASRPIVLSDQTRLPASKACLIRVLNKEGKNMVLMMGVDLDYHSSFRSASDRWPNDCLDLDVWLQDVVDEYEQEDSNAEEGVAVYLYCNRAIVEIQPEIGTAVMTRYYRSDFPVGFPLKQMRQVKQVQAGKASLGNRVIEQTAKKADGGEVKKDRP